jgi:glycosyltransferase involved in cell wall biosynthesis
MRIIQVVDSLAPGGAERVVLMLSAGLTRRGHEVVLAVSEPGAILDAAVASDVEYRSIEHSAPAGVDGMIKLRRLIREVRADVLHCHLLGSDIVGRTTGILTSGPVVVSTMHERTPRGWAYDAFRVITGRLITGTVACSSDVEEYCRVRLHVPASRLFRVDNGVDTQAFAVSRRDFNRVRTIAIVASHIPRKGHRYLFAAMRTVLPEHPDLRLLVLGTGPLEGSLKNMAAEMGIAGAVDFLGARPDVAHVLRDVEAVVLPSLDEGLPIAVLEAMAARKVVVASAVSAVPEVLDHGRAGVLVPPADERALALALRSVLADPEPLRIADAALSRVEAQYSADVMVDGYLDVYERLGAS